MAKETDFFAAAPMRAIGDPGLTGTDLRTLLAISFHDRRSIPQGKGRGCVASNTTLAKEVGTDITTISRSISKLVRLGYVVKEAQPNDRRKHTIRVIFDQPDSWQSCQVSTSSDAGQIVGDPANDPAEMVGRFANDHGEIVGNQFSETRRNLPKSDTQEILLNRERDCVETRRDSVETAHRGDAVCNQEDVSDLVKATIGSLGQRAKGKELPSSGIALRDLLPESFTKLSLDAQLDHWERALKRINWSDDRLIEAEMSLMREWLEDVANQYERRESTAGARAQRMLERLWEQDEALAKLHHTMNGSAVCRA